MFVYMVEKKHFIQSETKKTEVAPVSQGYNFSLPVIIHNRLTTCQSDILTNEVIS